MTPATEESPTQKGPLAWVGNLLIGLLLFALGAAPLYFDLRRGSTLNFPGWFDGVLVGVAVLGCLAIRPDPIIGGAKRASSVAIVIIKSIRGQSESTTVTVSHDPPAAPAPAAPAPPADPMPPA